MYRFAVAFVWALLSLGRADVVCKTLLESLKNDTSMFGSSSVCDNFFSAAYTDYTTLTIPSQFDEWFGTQNETIGCMCLGTYLTNNPHYSDYSCLATAVSDCDEYCKTSILSQAQAPEFDCASTWMDKTESTMNGTYLALLAQQYLTDTDCIQSIYTSVEYNLAYTCDSNPIYAYLEENAANSSISAESSTTTPTSAPTKPPTTAAPTHAPTHAPTPTPLQTLPPTVPQINLTSSPVIPVSTQITTASPVTTNAATAVTSTPTDVTVTGSTTAAHETTQEPTPVVDTTEEVFTETSQTPSSTVLLEYPSTKQQVEGLLVVAIIILAFCIVIVWYGRKMRGPETPYQHFATVDAEVGSQTDNISIKSETQQDSELGENTTDGVGVVAIQGIVGSDDDISDDSMRDYAPKPPSNATKIKYTLKAKAEALKLKIKKRRRKEPTVIVPMVPVQKKDSSSPKGPPSAPVITGRGSSSDKELVSVQVSLSSKQSGNAAAKHSESGATPVKEEQDVFTIATGDDEKDDFQYYTTSSDSEDDANTGKQKSKGTVEATTSAVSAVAAAHHHRTEITAGGTQREYDDGSSMSDDELEEPMEVLVKLENVPQHHRPQPSYQGTFARPGSGSGSGSRKGKKKKKGKSEEEALMMSHETEEQWANWLDP